MSTPRPPPTRSLLPPVTLASLSVVLPRAQTHSTACYRKGEVKKVKKGDEVRHV